MAAVPGGGVLGIGTFDDSPGKRIAMGWVHELFRLTFDPESPVCRFGCGNKDYLNWWDYLIIHEGGHIFGQHHTFHKVNIDGSLGTNESFSSVWSSMSYQDDGRCVDLGAIDHASWLRNRAGFALLLAAQEGREGSAAWRAAMEAASHLDWPGVWSALQTPGQSSRCHLAWTLSTWYAHQMPNTRPGVSPGSHAMAAHRTFDDRSSCGWTCY